MAVTCPVCPVVPSMNSMWRTGTPAPASKAWATRLPDPVKMSASAFPDLHPGRLMISCRTALRLDVRWLTPASPTTVHGGGVHEAAVVVRSREETLKAAVVKVRALSDASP
jgi:hypothetical protein